VVLQGETVIWGGGFFGKKWVKFLKNVKRKKKEKNGSDLYPTPNKKYFYKTFILYSTQCRHYINDIKKNDTGNSKHARLLHELALRKSGSY
jgi:hypothetical protein